MLTPSNILIYILEAVCHQTTDNFRRKKPIRRTFRLNI